MQIKAIWGRKWFFKKKKTSLVLGCKKILIAANHYIVILTNAINLSSYKSKTRCEMGFLILYIAGTACLL